MEIHKLSFQPTKTHKLPPFLAEYPRHLKRKATFFYTTHGAPNKLQISLTPLFKLTYDHQRELETSLHRFSVSQEGQVVET